jgi:hypothetical protein
VFINKQNGTSVFGIVNSHGNYRLGCHRTVLSSYDDATVFKRELELIVSVEAGRSMFRGRRHGYLFSFLSGAAIDAIAEREENMGVDLEAVAQEKRSNSSSW